MILPRANTGHDNAVAPIVLSAPKFSRVCRYNRRLHLVSKLSVRPQPHSDGHARKLLHNN